MTLVNGLPKPGPLLKPQQEPTLKELTILEVTLAVTVPKWLRPNHFGGGSPRKFAKLNHQGQRELPPERTILDSRGELPQGG